MNIKRHRIRRPLQNESKLTVRERIFRSLYPFWSMKLSTKLRRRRIDVMNKLLDGKLFNSKRVLEVGCANGQDFVSLFEEQDDMEIFGMDLEDYKIKQDNFTFILGDAERIDYPDKYFDVGVSIGVFEHIQPIEKLCKAITEIDRVSKHFCVIVPSIGTILEPHAAEILWHLRDHNKKSKRGNLNYFSDESWMKFNGFQKASVCSFWYLPPLIKNLVIYKH